jgi:hypothetical protein
MDGMGVMTYPDGSYYIGQFENEKMCGKGRMTQANGDVFQGDWKNNMANGNGCIVNTQGVTESGSTICNTDSGKKPGSSERSNLVASTSKVKS